MDASMLAGLLKGHASAAKDAGGGSPGDLVAGVLTMPLDLAEMVIDKADDLAELFIKTLVDAGYEIVKMATPG